MAPRPIANNCKLSKMNFSAKSIRAVLKSRTAAAAAAAAAACLIKFLKCCHKPKSITHSLAVARTAVRCEGMNGLTPECLSVEWMELVLRIITFGINCQQPLTIESYFNVVPDY